MPRNAAHVVLLPARGAEMTIDLRALAIQLVLGNVEMDATLLDWVMGESNGRPTS